MRGHKLATGQEIIFSLDNLTKINLYKEYVGENFLKEGLPFARLLFISYFGEFSQIHPREC